MVEKILEHGNHKLSEKDLIVSAAPAEVLNDENKESEGRKVNDEKIRTNAILIEGLDSAFEREMLELFFENTKRSGGGEIQNIKMYQKSGRAIIWFAEDEGRK